MSASSRREKIVAGAWAPAWFRNELTAVSLLDRDAWFDAILGIEQLPDDDALPSGCVPYLPATVEALRVLAERRLVTREDTFVDVGGGIGRAAIAAHLLTGATACLVELQPTLVEQARALIASLRLPISVVHGDALTATPAGTVYFLYCPFDASHLDRWLRHVDLTTGARIATLDVGLPDESRLSREDLGAGLRVYRVIG